MVGNVYFFHSPEQGALLNDKENILFIISMIKKDEGKVKHLHPLFIPGRNPSLEYMESWNIEHEYSKFKYQFRNKTILPRQMNSVIVQKYSCHVR